MVCISLVKIKVSFKQLESHKEQQQQKVQPWTLFFPYFYRREHYTVFHKIYEFK